MPGPLTHKLEAEELLRIADQYVSANYEVQTGEKKTDVLLAAIAHALLALVK